MIDATTALKDVAQMDGVKDLPMVVKAKFAQALIAEAKGEHDRAAQLLNEAVDKETELANRTAA